MTYLLPERGFRLLVAVAAGADADGCYTGTGQGLAVEAGLDGELSPFVTVSELLLQLAYGRLLDVSITRDEVVARLTDSGWAALGLPVFEMHLQASVPGRVRRVTASERDAGDRGLALLDQVIGDLLATPGVPEVVTTLFGALPAGLSAMTEAVVSLDGRDICDPSLSFLEFEQWRLCEDRDEVRRLLEQAFALLGNAPDADPDEAAGMRAWALARMCVARRQWQLALDWPTLRGPEGGWLVSCMDYSTWMGFFAELRDAEVDMLSAPAEAEPAEGWPYPVRLLREAPRPGNERAVH